MSGTDAGELLEQLHPGAKALLDAYGDELARHGAEAPVSTVHRLDAERVYSLWHGRCRCGWEQERGVGKRAVANRAAGMHRAAAEKRASRAYDLAVGELIESRRNTSTKG